MRDAVERLTETHIVCLDGRMFTCDPLLHQLREACTSSIGAGSGGGSGDGGLLNLAALSLWDAIDGQARAWLQELTSDHRGELARVVRELPSAVQAAHVNGVIDDDTRDRVEALPAQWVHQIEDLFDPPHEKELTAPCPECGETHHVDGDTQRAAVFIPVKKGRAVVAECRCCGAMWATENDLIRLADGMGIEVDFVALRELTT